MQAPLASRNACSVTELQTTPRTSDVKRETRPMENEKLNLA
jgi:hypothetical protein